jgi:hypothetical protein
VAAPRKEKIVDPDAPLPAAPGVYPTLTRALYDAEPGDVILIRHNGELAVEAVRLEKPTTDVTIQRHPGYQPVLTLGGTTERQATLFTLHDGRLTLKGLEFRLRPRNAEFKSQAVVTVVGDGQCVFKECVASLVGLERVALSLVALGDPRNVMKMDTAPPRPAGRPLLQLSDCFVRGEGNLVDVRASRPFELALDNALLVLGGSAVNVLEGRNDDAPVSGTVQVTCKNVTAYLTDHLLWLRSAKDVKGLVPVRVNAADSLFVPAGSKALIHLDGVEVSDSQLKQLLAWEGRGNRYGNPLMPMTMVDQLPKDSEMMMQPRAYSLELWKRLFGEGDAQPFRGRFPDLPPPDAPLSAV